MTPIRAPIPFSTGDNITNALIIASAAGINAFTNVAFIAANCAAIFSVACFDANFFCKSSEDIFVISAADNPKPFIVANCALSRLPILLLIINDF